MLRQRLQTTLEGASSNLAAPKKNGKSRAHSGGNMAQEDMEELRVLGNTFSNLACYREGNVKIQNTLMTIAERIEIIVRRSNP